MLKRIITIILCFCMIVSSTLVFADDVGEKPYTYEEIYKLIDTLGTDLTPKNWLESIRFEGKGSGKVVDVEGQDFDKAYRVIVPERGDSSWSTQFWIDFDGSNIKVGDAVFVSYKIKPIETFDEMAMVRVDGKLRPNGDHKNDYQIIAKFSQPVSDNWLEGRIIKQAVIDGSDKGTLCMQAGQAVQTFEMADLKIINFGSYIEPSRFPVKITSWLGMEEDAQWRKEAFERIEQIRKSEFEVTVTDAGGNPIPNAEVQINQKEHAFRHGSTFPTKQFDSKNESLRKKVLDQFLSMFNQSGYTFQMKAAYIEQNAELLDRCLTWMEENNITCRGHTYVWTPKYIQKEVKDEVMASGDAMKEYIREHITKYGERYRGRISTWDVANEQVTNKEIWTLTGKEDMVEWFKLAKEADPYAKTALNDYGILGTDLNHRDAHYELVKYLLDNGAPIDVAGIQGHISTTANPQTALTAINKFASLGVDVQITELTANISDPELHGKFIRDMLIVFFSHPAVESVLTWGYIAGTDEDSKNTALVNADYSLKPAGEAWMDLFYNQWWTKEAGKTDGSGKFMTRAFFGEQEVTVTVNGKTASVVVPVDFKGAKVTAVVGGDIFFKEPTVYDETREEPDKKTRVVDLTVFGDAADTNTAPAKDEGKKEVVVDNSYKGPFDIEFHWARKNIEKLIAKNIVNGYADGSFKPENQINVDEFIKLCVAANGTKVKNAYGYWADSWIDKAIDLGYFAKDDFDSYTRPITREEMAYIVANAKASVEVPKTEAPAEKKKLTDIETCFAKFAEGVKKVFELGIITGYEDGSFRPNNNAKRAEAVVVIERMMNVK